MTEGIEVVVGVRSKHFWIEIESGRLLASHASGRRIENDYAMNVLLHHKNSKTVVGERDRVTGCPWLVGILDCSCVADISRLDAPEDFTRVRAQSAYSTTATAHNYRIFIIVDDEPDRSPSESPFSIAVAIVCIDCVRAAESIDSFIGVRRKHPRTSVTSFDEQLAIEMGLHRQAELEYPGVMVIESVVVDGSPVETEDDGWRVGCADVRWRVDGVPVDGHTGVTVNRCPDHLLGFSVSDLEKAWLNVIGGDGRKDFVCVSVEKQNGCATLSCLCSVGSNHGIAVGCVPKDGVETACVLCQVVQANSFSWRGKYQERKKCSVSAHRFLQQNCQQPLFYHIL